MAIKTERKDLFYKILGTFTQFLGEDLTGTARPLWRFYSKYDEDVDVSVPVAMGDLQGVLPRCVMGWSGVDETFQGIYDQGGDLGLYRSSVGVFYPSLPVERFCDHWFKHHPTLDRIPRVIDAELFDGQSDAVIGEKLWHSCEYIYQQDGVWPWIYSRYMLLDRWLKYWTTDMLSKPKYYLARYLFDRTREHPGPPVGNMVNVTIPPENIVLQQTADKKAPYPGETSRSTIVCWERWELGNVNDQNAWIDANYPADGIPKPPPVDDEWKRQVNYTLADHEQRINTLEVNTITFPVKAKKQFPLRIVVGEDGRGKPIVEPPSDMGDRTIIKEKQEFRVMIHPNPMSEKDVPGSPVIKTANGEAYITQDGLFALCEFVEWA